MEDRVSDFANSEIEKAVDVLTAMRHDAALLDTVRAVGQVCANALKGDGKVMFCGNGGSAADSQHLAAELVGKLQFARPGLAGLALTTDSSALSAIGNDYGYEHTFSRQVEAVGRKGDVIVGISTSGRSRNVLAALERARALEIVTVGMTGSGPGSTAIAAVSDYCLKVPSDETQKIQEGHIVLGHIFCALAEEGVFPEGKSAG
jgi:D-sedoheptulose 7-phosphate isomerase